MSEQPPEGVRFQFSVARDKEDKFQHVVLTYREATAHIDFMDTEEGQIDFGRLIVSLPQVLRLVRQEVLIRQETDGVDEELVQLLDTGGDCE